MAASLIRDTRNALDDLALDLRWAWNHEADWLWQQIDADGWEQTRNPWNILRRISTGRLDSLAADPAFSEELKRVVEGRRAYLDATGWFASTYGEGTLKGVAYFSMEFGVDEALPLYAGGLG